MPVTVEYFGIPRRRAGVPTDVVEAATLGALLQRLAEMRPELAADCFDGNTLHRDCLANVNGDRFTTDPATPLADGDHVLLLSADVGG